MIDVETDELLPLARAGRVLNPAAPPHNSTLWRWALGGVRGVKLETVRIGGRTFTSREALLRFMAALNAPPGAPAPPAPPTARARRAAEKLRAMGC